MTACLTFFSDASACLVIHLCCRKKSCSPHCGTNTSYLLNCRLVTLTGFITAAHFLQREQKLLSFFFFFFSPGNIRVTETSHSLSCHARCSAASTINLHQQSVCRGPGVLLCNISCSWIRCIIYFINIYIFIKINPWKWHALLWARSVPVKHSPGLQISKSMAPPMLSIFWMMVLARAAGLNRTGRLLCVRWRLTGLYGIKFKPLLRSLSDSAASIQSHDSTGT